MLEMLRRRKSYVCIYWGNLTIYEELQRGKVGAYPKKKKKRGYSCNVPNRVMMIKFLAWDDWCKELPALVNFMQIGRAHV